VGVMAGNCEQYISVFFAAARVGAILVVLNNTYTPSELSYALSHSGMIQPNLVFEPCRSLQTIADQELHRSIQVADFSS
jgi:acyl-CoA synthetase (AMP-forming)/AMP-acid ligase II